MRTYTVREVRGTGPDTRLVVDFVLHEADGAAGPGSAWASAARVGDRLVILAPRRGAAFGGIEFVPGGAGRLLIAADETAVPAACSILADLPPDAHGAVFLEVPMTADAAGAVPDRGRGRLAAARRCAAGLVARAGGAGAPGASPAIEPTEVEPDLWETPSSIVGGTGRGSGGHSGPARRLRVDRRGVRGGHRAAQGAGGGAGLDRRQVAFMGYWRRGVAGGGGLVLSCRSGRRGPEPGQPVPGRIPGQPRVARG